jgi:uncharacterized repeat protein (TIGR02059 family)
MLYLRLKLLLLSITISLSLSGATYYISPTGSDVTGNGTTGSPWKTLNYACTQVTKSGDIIHVNAGTYIETKQCDLAVGVSIEGEGDSSNIISHYTASYASNNASIVLMSGSEGTNGNQSISYIKLDGDGLTGDYAIKILKRSNVKIHHCTIIDFYIGGVLFLGTAPWQRPSIFATGNELHHCSITNCGDMQNSYEGAGLVQIGGQDGMKIYDNILDESVRAEGHNGNILSSAHFNKGIKYYNNKSYKPDYDGEYGGASSWNFHIEHWSCYGGFEIYNNEFYGGDTAIDCGGDYNEKGAYDYTFYIHDNYFYGNPTNSHSGKLGVNIEGHYTCDIWVKNNHFNNIAHPVQIDEGDPEACEASRIYITNNLMENCGMVGYENWQGLVRILHTFSGSILNDIFIYNNIITPNSVTHSTAVQIDNSGTASNINIKNNIITGHNNQSWLRVNNTGSINGLHITHNGLYNNSSNDPIFSGNAPTDYQFANNITSNPLLVSSTDYHLQSSSPYIDAGTDVGISYSGRAPDIGAFEYQSGLPAPSPIFINSVVENATPTLIGMTYDLTLANIIPSPSAFSVKVNSTARTINSVAISGTKVLLTLSSAVVNGDVVTVAYTKPATNPIQTASGGQAATLSAQTVVNNVSPIIPVYVSSAIQNSTPNILEITYNLGLAIVVPAASAFSIKVNSVSRTVNTVTISGTKVLLTLANPVINGDVITVSYTKPSTNPIQTTSGGQATTLSAQTVTNNVIPGTPPVYVSSAIENATPNILEMTYNLSLASIIPATSAFTVSVNSLARTVNTISISGAKVLLTLASPVVYGDIVTVSYTKSSSNPIQTSSGGQAATISAQAVTNKISNPASLGYINSAVGNSSPTLLEMNFNLTLANILPATSAFSVSVNSVNRNVNSVAISGSSIILTLATAVVYSDVITVAYTKPVTNPLQSISGLLAATMGAQPVTNKVDPVGPVYVSSSIENLTPNILEITFNETLDLTVPDVSAFVVTVNVVKRGVSSVSISGNKVRLTLISPVVYGDVVTVSYIKPASNQLKKASGETAVSFSFPQPVTNKVANNSIKKKNITIYPNPAREFINVSQLEASSEAKIIRIFDFSGKLCSETKVTPYTSDLHVEINLRSGTYLVQIATNSLILYTQKLIVMNY